MNDQNNKQRMRVLPYKSDTCILYLVINYFTVFKWNNISISIFFGFANTKWEIIKQSEFS